MSDTSDKYYYTMVTNPYEILETESIDELITLLYEAKANFLTEGQILSLKLPKNYLEDLRQIISSYEERVPMYDVKSNNIFLIARENVYPRIFYDNYRFIDQNFYDELLQIKNPSPNDQANVRFLSYYDLSVLYQTYLKIFYESFVLSSYITNCRRPSYSFGMEHISPYYKIDELNYLANDWGLIKKITFDPIELRHLCQEIIKHDIPAETLIEHQMYIYQSKAIGLVKHYSLFGSYYMNQYLRRNKCCFPEMTDYEGAIRNLYLENQIKIMIRLIKNAPPLTKDHTVYRFVEKDDYLRHLKVGDIYRDSSFMSTTRNPFYYKENYAFGYILIRIRLPANVRGIGLSIEAYSNFPSEEEIILPPTSSYRLDSITDSQETQQYHGAFDLKVQKRYDFTWISNDYLNKKDSEIYLDMPGATIPDIPKADLKDLLVDENIKYLTVTDRLKYFRDNFTNVHNQFESKIGQYTYLFNFEAYDASSVYKPFFYYEGSNGIMITTANPKYGNINILMELGTDIHINYYFRYSVTDLSIVVDLDTPEWMEWLSLLAYVIGSRTVIIHSNYGLQFDPNDSIERKIMKTRYTFSTNIYAYMKYKKKMFQYVEVVPQFDYAQLDYLAGVSIYDIIKPTDKNELYRIAQVSGLSNMYDFYLYVIENYPKLIDTIQNKMSEIYEPENNPFLNVAYTLDAWLYLYNRDLIRHIPSEREFVVKKGSFKKLIGDKKIPKFKNRLRTFLLSKKN